MSTDDTALTQQTARRYFRAWTGRDTSTTRSVLAEDFRFAAGDMRVSGRDAFLEAGLSG
jgi:hypothetical protein